MLFHEKGNANDWSTQEGRVSGLSGTMVVVSAVGHGME